MNEPSVFHIGLNQEMLQGARVAIIPGDPARVERIASLMEEPILLASQREFTSWLGRLDGVPVVVCSTGIGGPSTSVAVEELAQLGIRSFLRIGTTGAIQPHVNVGDIIITTGSVRLDGASSHFAPMKYPAVADYHWVKALDEVAQAEGVRPHIGITASSDTFYPGQERYDTVSGRVRKPLQGSVDEWRDMGVLNFEMESATLFTMCSVNGWQAGCVSGVIVNRTQQEIPDESLIGNTEKLAVKIAVEAARKMAKAPI